MPLNMYSVLTINGGSSSIKFSLYQNTIPLQLKLSGKISRIGLSGTTLNYSRPDTGAHNRLDLVAADHASAVNFLINWLEPMLASSQLVAIGHRIVHGLQHTQPELVSSALLHELHGISGYDPEHLPLEIKLIEACQRHYPQLPQVACFDTAFHHTLPGVAKRLPIPRHFAALGLQRYGFHGLSYEYLMQELERIAGKQASQGRVILAHLGNGASLAAVRNGQSIDTSMGFTPSGGLPMGTRSGDLDPGVAWYLMQKEKLTPEQFNHLINHESGLLGVSETSSDMHDLLLHAATDERAAEAVELFCYQVKKWIGSYAAVLGGLDTLVFSGGIGENAPLIRARICAGLAFLGPEIDEASNDANAAVISSKASVIAVRVMHTNEELIIAQSTFNLLGDAVRQRAAYA